MTDRVHTIQPYVQRRGLMDFELQQIRDKAALGTGLDTSDGYALLDHIGGLEYGIRKLSADLAAVKAILSSTQDAYNMVRDDLAAAREALRQIDAETAYPEIGSRRKLIAVKRIVRAVLAAGGGEEPA